MTQIWVLYRQSGSDRLEKQPTDLRQYTCYFGDRTLARKNRAKTDEQVRKSGVAGVAGCKGRRLVTVHRPEIRRLILQLLNS